MTAQDQHLDATRVPAVQASGPVTCHWLWFGPEAEPLFGRLFLPEDAMVKGGVVLCPPVGVEAQASARAYKTIARRLASHGFAVLQVDYAGTGDSADPDATKPLLVAWQESVEAAVNLLRSWGAGRVSVVAMRLGATIAASVAANCGLSSLVIWDPCESGRTYLREQILLRQVYIEDDGLEQIAKASSRATGSDGDVEVLGSVYDSATTRSVGDLRLSDAPGPLAERVLLLLRPRRTLRPATAERLARERLDSVEAGGQEELLSVWPLRAVVPEQTIGLIINWLEDGSRGHRSLFAPEPSTSARIPSDASSPDAMAPAIVEQVLQLGPHRLFGIASRPATASSGPHPTVLLLNAGKLDHTGPGRLWVEVARAWARAGIDVVRADLSGLGDSPPRPGQPCDVAYVDSARGDIADMAAALLPGRERDLILIGICAGGFHAVAAGAEMGAKHVLAINPQWPRPTTVQRTAKGEAGDNWPGLQTPSARYPSRRFAETLALVRRAGRKLPAYGAAKAVGHWLFDTRWWFANRLGDQVRPVRDLEKIARLGGHALLVCRPYEALLVSRGDKGRLRRLCSGRHAQLEVLRTIDNSLYLATARQAAVPVLTSHVLRAANVASPSLTARSAVSGLNLPVTNR